MVPIAPHFNEQGKHRENSKFQKHKNSTSVRTTEKKIQEKVGSHVNENEKYSLKKSMFFFVFVFFFKIKKKKVRGMALGKQQAKFERNPRNRFRDNRCHRRTTNEI